MGPSGSGKTSLLRTLRGLWCTIERQGGADVNASLEDPGIFGQRVGGASDMWQMSCVPLLQQADGGSGGGGGARCMFLPQAVYMLPRASLREQLAYPLSVTTATTSATLRNDGKYTANPHHVLVPGTFLRDRLWSQPPSSRCLATSLACQ